MSRSANVAVAALLLVVALPVFLVVAIAIVAESRGPVFFRARRVGLEGREFEMLKFRKMRCDAAGPRLTRRDDDRFTRVGRFLTRTKLDELPQLINVLRGDMALVGPRPEDPHYVQRYPDRFAKILHVRPGITGLTQLTFIDESASLVGDDFESHYENVILPKKIESDCYYIDHRSMRLDMKILRQTIQASLGRVATVNGANGDGGPRDPGANGDGPASPAATLPKETSKR